jgi:hypothetical protein
VPQACLLTSRPPQTRRCVSNGVTRLTQLLNQSSLTRIAPPQTVIFSGNLAAGPGIRPDTFLPEKYSA